VLPEVVAALGSDAGRDAEEIDGAGQSVAEAKAVWGAAKADFETERFRREQRRMGVEKLRLRPRPVGLG
jgi:hypothetical protein